MQNSPIKIGRFNSNVDSKANLKEVVEKTYLVNFNFFGKEVGEIKVNFLYSREEFNKEKGRETEPWVVGFTKKEEVYIFSPAIFDKVSSHQKSDFEFTLRHEIAHIFTKRIYGFFYPVWLYEGIAGFVAEQYKLRKISKEQIQSFSELHDDASWNKNHNYTQAFSFTKYLFGQYGKEKVLDFVSIISQTGKENSFEVFVGLFHDYFNKNFEEIFNKWKMLF